MKTLPKYWAVKTDETHPIWEKFKEWIVEESGIENWSFRCNFYGNGDANTNTKGFAGYSEISYFSNPVTLITLEEWDSIVSGTKPTKSLSYETQYLRSDGTLFTKDTIDGKNIEDLKQEMNNHVAEANKIRGLLKAHKNKF